MFSFVFLHKISEPCYQFHDLLSSSNSYVMAIDNFEYVTIHANPFLKCSTFLREKEHMTLKLSFPVSTTSLVPTKVLLLLLLLMC